MTPPSPVSSLRSVAQQVAQTTAVPCCQAQRRLCRQAGAKPSACARPRPWARGCVTQATSLGVEDMVITHLTRQWHLDLPVFVLDTGALHTETLALLERMQAHARASTVVYHACIRGGDRLHASAWPGCACTDSIALRKQCCDMRKMEPLARALAGKQGWITGLRREQSNARAEVPLVDTAEVATRG